MTNQTRFEQTLNLIASTDVRTLVKKDAEYGSSWKKRGGVGAFMMLARKWDRLETQVTRSGLDTKWDIFDAIGQDEGTLAPPSGKAIARNPITESTLETIRDLRRYLLLVESEIMLRKEVDRGGTIKPADRVGPGVAMVADSEYAHPFPAGPSQDRTRGSGALHRIPVTMGMNAKFGDRVETARGWGILKGPIDADGMALVQLESGV